MFERLVEGGFGGERPADFGAEEAHVLTDLVGVGVFESRRVLAEFSGHAGDDDFTHAAATGRGQAFSYKVPGSPGRRASAPDLVRPPVQKTMVEPPERNCDFTQMRMVSM